MLRVGKAGVDVGVADADLEDVHAVLVAVTAHAAEAEQLVVLGERDRGLAVA